MAVSYTGRAVGPRMRRRFPIPRGYMVYNSQERPLIEELTEAVQSLAQLIGETVPEGTRQELALVALEEVQMRAMRAHEIPELRLDAPETASPRPGQ